MPRTTMRGTAKRSRSGIAERVFQELHDRILSLDLPPGFRMSEAEIARDLGVSRQPVRDAFSRLSQMGFLDIRPQSGTAIRLISAAAVERGRFVRTALEAEAIRRATECLKPEDIDALEQIVESQSCAAARDDYAQFHALDDLMHREICTMAGLGYVWELIRPQKAHMDRVRFLTLDIGSFQALEEHRAILDALRTGGADIAEERMRQHLSHITRLVEKARVRYAYAFDESDEPDPVPVSIATVTQG